MQEGDRKVTLHEAARSGHPNMIQVGFDVNAFDRVSLFMIFVCPLCRSLQHLYMWQLAVVTYTW